jgi:hypothetical protein
MTTSRCERCGAPIHRIRPAEGKIGTCADVYAPEMSTLTPEQQREWAEDVSHAEELAKHGHNSLEVLWGETTLAVNARLVALERVATAARELDGAIVDEVAMRLHGDAADKDTARAEVSRALRVLRSALTALANKEAK